MNEMINGYDHQEDSLTWLARNIDVNELNGFSHARITEGKIQYYSGWNPSGAYTSEEILHRRAELQNKPSWDEMPEWADVWIEDLCTPSQSGWHKDSGDRFIDRCRCSYRKINMDEEQIVHYPPETKPEWNGEGLPPIGTVCEMLVGDDLIGDRVLIMGYYNDLVWVTVQFWDDGVVYHGRHNTFTLTQDLTFRPTKSDKEKWVEQLCKTLSIVPNGSDWLDAIYDALISGELPIPKGIKNESK